MYAHVRNALVLGGLFTLCFCLATFSESSEPTDLELSSVWGGIACSECKTWTTDCDSPEDECFWDDELFVCVGACATNSCEMDDAGGCESPSPGNNCTPTVRYCRAYPVHTCDCVKIVWGECGPDEKWQYYSCENGSYSSCD